MPSNYSPDLRIELMANGEKSGTWGTITNSNLGIIIEDAISGLANVTLTATNQPLTVYDGIADQARNAAIRVTTALTTPLNVYVPPVSKLYVFINACSVAVTVYASTVAGNTTAAGLGITIPANCSTLIRCDTSTGINMVEQMNRVVGDFTVGGVFSVSGVGNFNGNVLVNGSAFLGTSQTALIGIASPPTPSVITVANTPPNYAAVTFAVSTGGTLPTGISSGTLYYVSRIDGTTFNISTSPTLTPLVTATAIGSGTFTVRTASSAITPDADSNDEQIATTAFVRTSSQNVPSAQELATANWTVSETVVTQTAAIPPATPALVTVAVAPPNGTAVAYTATTSLPTGLTANVAYYVFNRTSTTYNLATTSGQTQTALITIASPGVITVAAAPNNGDLVTFSTTGTLPTGITVGANYYAVNRTATTFQISATAGGSAINFSGSQSGMQSATWRTLVNTTAAGTGTITETASKIVFAYKALNKMSVDLGGNIVTTGNVTAYGAV